MGRIVSFHGHTKWEWGYKAFKRLYSAFTIDGLLATFCLPRLACNIIHVYEASETEWSYQRQRIQLATRRFCQDIQEMRNGKNIISVLWCSMQVTMRTWHVLKVDTGLFFPLPLKAARNQIKSL